MIGFGEVLGIIGVCIIGINFLLEASDKLSKDHHWFVVLNLISSLFLFTYAYIAKVTLFVILNGMLILISIYQLIVIKIKKK